MKIYNTQEEVEKDIVNDVLVIKGDVKFNADISIAASILVIEGNITAESITAWDINAWDINAENITARDITAKDINAWGINAKDILYYAFCTVYRSIKCVSIKAKRGIAHPPICLDGKLEIKEEEKKK